MPRSRSVHAIFDEFVASLTALIKEKVAQAVQTATDDFCATRFGGAVQAPAKPIVRRRRSRSPAEPTPTVARKLRRGGVTSPKPVAEGVRLSKYGKRLGRPPKAAVTTPPTET